MCSDGKAVDGTRSRLAFAQRTRRLSWSSRSRLTPTELLVELREHVATFTKEAPATDDRTAIIIKAISHKP